MKKTLIIISVLIGILLLGGLFYYLYKSGKIIPHAAAGPSINLSPSSGTYNVGGTFSITINVDTAGQAIAGAQLRFLNYNPQVLEIQDSDSNTAGVQIKAGTMFDSYIANEVDTNTGKISLSAGNLNSNNTFTGQGVLATATFRAKAAASTSLTIDFAPGAADTSKLVEPTSASNILASVTNGSYTIKQPTPAPTLDLKANGSNGPVTINSGSSATLSWSSTNATTCSASSGWSGGKATSGSESTGSLTTSKSYVLTCSGSGGSAKDSVIVNVQVPGKQPPTVDLKINDSDDPIIIDSGSSATLSWTSAGANTCTASEDWSGDKGTSGSESTGNLDSSKTYILACQGDGGGASDSVSVNISESSSPENQENPPAVEPTTQATTPTETSTSPSTAVTKLPTNLNPKTTPEKKTLELYKNQAFKTWALWFIYAIIPAFLAGGAIYFYLRRKKKNKNDQVI